jgi:hypothetical protein
MFAIGNPLTVGCIVGSPIYVASHTPIRVFRLLAS